MDKRKLIGTIIGVTMFAALIAGATFAWLTFTATVTNGTYNSKTKNFIITYKGGSEVSDLLQTSNPTPGTLTIGKVTVTASKTANSAKASSFKLNLDISSNSLTTKSIGYAVCKGTCADDTKLATISGTGTNTTASCAASSTNVVSCGVFTGTTDLTLYNDTTTFNTDSAVNTTTYNIYFWLNSGSLVAADVGKTFSGKIFAEATQGN